MRRTTAVLVVGALLSFAACSAPDQTTVPTLSPDDAALERGRGDQARTVSVWDACDPQSFNKVLGEGACIRQGGVTFDKFIGELKRTGSAAAWRFAPTQLTIKLGQSFSAINRGGEDHTFTEVDEFGGGINDNLNKLSGNTTVAPECKALNLPADILEPGEVFHDTPSAAGSEKYQCCIHPWMRMTLTIKA
jgi:plastocyanin